MKNVAANGAKSAKTCFAASHYRLNLRKRSAI